MISRRRWAFKYWVERLVALLVLFMTAPILGILALLVWSSDGRPILYTTDRLGIYGRSFRLYKFRSMALDSPLMLAEDGKVLTLRNDPRLTRIGRFLRLGFDELPQLINVLKGDMCLIGPRPDVTWELGRYTPRQRKRLEVLPGISGLAQVVGGRYMTNEKNYELDVRYVERSSWKTDLIISALTLPYSMGLEFLGVRFLRNYLDRLTESDNGTTEDALGVGRG